MKTVLKLTSFLGSLLIVDPDLLFAYVGPGPGLNFIYSFIALLGAIITSIGFIIVWTFKSIFKKGKKKK